MIIFSTDTWERVKVLSNADFFSEMESLCLSETTSIKVNGINAADRLALVEVEQHLSVSPTSVFSKKV